MLKFSCACGVFGLMVSLLFSAYWQFETRFFKIEFLSNELFDFQLLFWPSSIGMMATAGATSQESLKMWLLVTGINILFYTFLGALVWLGINIHKLFFVLPVSIIAFICYLIWL